MSGAVSFTVLVSPACGSCAGARAVTERFASENGATVLVLDVTQPDAVLPRGFVGTPMVYLADTVVSYGTPTIEQLRSAHAREAQTLE